MRHLSSDSEHLEFIWVNVFVCVLEICPGIASLRSEGPRFREQLEPQPQPQLPTLRGGGGGGPPSPVADSRIVSRKETFLKDPSCPIYGPTSLRGHRRGRQRGRLVSAPGQLSLKETLWKRSVRPELRSERPAAQGAPGNTRIISHLAPLFIFISAEVWEPVNNRQLGWQEITRISEWNVIILATGLGQNRPVRVSCLFISRLWRLPRSGTRVMRVFAERTLIKIS